MKKWLFFLLLLLAGRCFSQDSLQLPVIGITGNYGFLIPHHEVMNYMIRDHTTCVELAVGVQTDGSKSWHRVFNYPRYGAIASYWEFGSAYLGRGAGLMAFMDFPLEPSRSLFLRSGLGFGLVEKPFDLEDNLYNSAIGSPLNATIKLELTGRIVILPWLAVRPGIGIHHFSNGAFTKPNKGINIASANVTLEFFGGPNRMPQKPVVFKMPERRNTFRGGASLGLKQLHIEGKRYLVVDAFGLFMRRISPKSSVGIQAGVIFNESIADAMAAKNQLSTDKTDYLRPYLAPSYMLHFGRFGLMLQAGGYLYNAYQVDGNIFLRYQLHYELNQKWNIFGGLKSHYAKADNIEIGTSFTLP